MKRVIKWAWHSFSERVETVVVIGVVFFTERVDGLVLDDRLVFGERIFGFVVAGRVAVAVAGAVAMIVVVAERIGADARRLRGRGGGRSAAAVG